MTDEKPYPEFALPLDLSWIHDCILTAEQS